MAKAKKKFTLVGLIIASVVALVVGVMASDKIKEKLPMSNES